MVDVTVLDKFNLILYTDEQILFRLSVYEIKSLSHLQHSVEIEDIYGIYTETFKQQSYAEQERYIA